MPSYLEAYRLSRAQAQGLQSPIPKETADDFDRTIVNKPKSDQKRNVSKRSAVIAASAEVNGANDEALKASSAKSFEAAKFNLDKVQGNNDTKFSKEKVLKWRSSDGEPTLPGGDVATGATTRRKTADRLTANKKPTVAVLKTNTDNTNDALRQNPQTLANEDGPGNRSRSASSPKKRLISDEHWLNGPLSPNDATAAPSKTTPMLRETSVFARPGSSKPDAWMRRKSTPGKRNLLSNEKKVMFEGIGQLGTNIATVKTDDLLSRETSMDRNKRNTSSILGVTPTTEIKNPEVLRTTNSKINEKEGANNSNSPPKFGRSTEDVVNPRKGAWTRKRVPRRLSYSSGFSYDDEESNIGDGDSAPPRIIPGRMDAWLAQTPDPFVEKLDDPLTGDMKPLSISDTDSIALEKISVRQIDASHRNKCRTKPNHGSRSPYQSDSEEYSTGSSSALKRSGARRGPLPAARKDIRAEFANNELQLASALPSKSKSKVRNSQDANGNANTAKLRRNIRPDVAKRLNLNRSLASHADLLSVLSQPSGVRGIVSARDVRTSRKQLSNATLSDLMNELRSDEAKYIRELRTLVDGVIPVLLSSVLPQTKSGSLDLLSGNASVSETSRETVINLGVATERLYNLHEELPTRSPQDFVSWAQKSHVPYGNYIKAWRLEFQNVVVSLARSESTQLQEAFGAKGDGERVDVTFLLKRPLVRLKYLAKTLKGIDQIQPSGETATLASKYQDLVHEVRLRQDREHARLEDEAASNIDATKVRDPETLAPLSGVRINRNRCVRARDVFDLKMHHSSGQRLDCHVILFLRDDFSGYGNRGDVLVAEVDSSSRWLLFPPAELPQLSARLGISKREIVIMIRGSSSVGQEWRELLSLRTTSEETATDWVKMLGSSPLPPAITASKAFKDTNFHRRDPNKAITLANSDQRRPPSPSELDVPLGEQSVVSFDRNEPNATLQPGRGGHVMPSRYYGRNQSPQLQPRSNRDQSFLQMNSSRSNELNGQTFSAPPSPNHTDSNNRAEHASSKVRDWLSNGRQPTSPLDKRDDLDSQDDYAHMDVLRKGGSQRPTISRRLSTVPSEGHVAVRRNRDGDTPAPVPLPLSRPAGLSDPNVASREYGEAVNASRSSPTQLRGVSTPHFSPLTRKSKCQRRSSSPLKHVYDLSSESDTSSVMGGLGSDDSGSVTSESSIDDLLPDPRIPPSALQGKAVRSSIIDRYTPKGLIRSSPTHVPTSISPQEQQSQEARRVVASIYSWSDKGMWNLLHPDECSIVVTPGIIEAFEMSAAHSAPINGVSLGYLEESFRAANRPLVALELTPLVPLRQSTAIDITIRSPPTPNSQLRAGDNIMFRSRTGQECEFLYNLINQARINNPTYVALQNARGPTGGSNWASYMDQQASKRGASSWWRLGSRKSSYRAGNTRRSGSLAETVSSVASMASAISALKRFSSGSNMFNVGKSTIVSHGVVNNEKSSSSIESSSGYSTPAILDPSKGSPAGLTDMKIRLYERETASKWRDMGSARLSIMHPPRSNSALISPTGHINQEKRVVIIGKTRGETLLDVTLGESSFERVARTGVAVKVWEQFDQTAKTGGVVSATMKVYMIQLKSEAEAAYTFSLVGRLRY